MFVSKHQFLRYSIYIITYGLLVALSFWFAYELRFVGTDSKNPENVAYITEQRPLAIYWVIVLKLFCLGLAGQFRGVFYYFRLPDALRLALALFAATAVMLLIPLFSAEANESNQDYSPSGIKVEVNKSMEGKKDNINRYTLPRGVTLIDFNLSLVLFMGLRVSIRALRERFWDLSNRSKGVVERIAIVGAGQAGAQLAAELLSRRGHGIEPVCFLDDNPNKHRLHIHGIPVIGAPERIPEISEKHGVTEIILALPSTSVRRVREITALASSANLRVLVVPSLTELAGGRVRASDIRPISVEDILGREPVKLDTGAIDDLVMGRIVLITGAGGSIGSELSRQVAARSPARLIILDQCEVLLYQIEQDLIAAGAGVVITPIIADVTDAIMLRNVFSRFRPGLVFHAAAHKHVPMMESQPAEALKNNVLGTHVVATLSSEFEVEKFVLISSDKAVNPTNVMGATKRLSEIVVRSVQAASSSRTNFLAVRFGNVLGSSGSVIPIFRRQIAAGGPVTVTHPEVKRYFMTIPEAVGLVLQSAALGVAGDILVLEMGEPLKIIDVARQLIELSGLRPELDIEIKIVGLRPGEKLVEELQHEGEHYRPTAHPRIYRFVSAGVYAGGTEELIRRVGELQELSTADCKQGIRKLVPEYVPFVE